MHLHEYANLDATAIADLVHRREVSARHVLECALAAAERVNPKINAICEWYVDEALCEVDSLDLDRRFSGVPFLIKDLVLERKGATCRQGSALVTCRPAIEDSELMARFRKAGFVTFGKTTTPPFGAHLITASRLWGETLNPWDTDYSPGGSSGGSAAAVASGIVPVAHANDGLGSIRIPAAVCGLFGLKPTRQRTPTGPLYGDLLGGRGVEFVISRTVRDAAGVLDMVHGPDPGAPYHIPPPERSFLEALNRPMKKLRIAFVRRCFSGQEADPEQVAAVERLARVYEELGHDVFEREPVLDWHAYVEGLFVIVVAGVHAAIRGACQVSGLVPGSEKMEPYLWATYERGAKFSSGDLLRAWSLLAASQRQIGRFFEDVDMLLTPVLNGSPIRAGLAEAVTDMDTFWQQFSGDALSPFTGIFNVTGQPAASIPALFPEGGIPIGVQAVTRFGREDTLFSVSRQIEEASPWSHQRPSLHASDA